MTMPSPRSLRPPSTYVPHVDRQVQVGQRHRGQGTRRGRDAAARTAGPTAGCACRRRSARTAAARPRRACRTSRRWSRRRAIASQIGTFTFGKNLSPTQTMIPTLMPMIGFSGPRLTPPASMRISATARPGQDDRLQRCGDEARASRGPARRDRAAYRTTSPISRPVTVSMMIVHGVAVRLEAERRRHVVPEPVRTGARRARSGRSARPSRRCPSGPPAGSRA